MLIQDTKDGKHLFQKIEGGTIFFRKRSGGRTIVESLKTQNPAKARVERAKRVVKYSENADLRAELPKFVSVSEIVEDYILWLHANHTNHVESVLNQEKTMRNTASHKIFLDYAGNSRPVASITSDDLRDYREELLDDENADATINNKLAYLRGAFRHGMRRQTPPKVLAIPYFPIVKVQNARQGFIDLEEYFSMVDEFRESLRPFFVLAYHTGCRKSELLNLQWPQVDFKRHWIVLEPGSTKNDEGRRIPFFGHIEEHLSRQREMQKAEFPDCPWVFFWHLKDVDKFGLKGEAGSQMTDVRALWTDTVTRLGHPDLLVHDLRRSAVMNMIQEFGFTEEEAMNWSGHKTRAMLQRYNIQKTATLVKTAAQADTKFKEIEAQARRLS
jgi:integrase